MSRIIFLISILLFLSATGCVSTFTEPVGDPEKALMDQKLIGTWYWKKKDERGFIHIGKSKKSGHMELAMIELSQNGRISISRLTGYCTKIENSNYINLKWIGPANRKFEDYIIVKYIIRNRELLLYFSDPSQLGEAVESGRLKGKIDRGKWVSDIKVTEKSERLRDFFANNYERIFKKATSLHRLTLP